MSKKKYLLTKKIKNPRNIPKEGEIKKVAHKQDGGYFIF